jgi:hypothetical protein
LNDHGLQATGAIFAGRVFLRMSRSSQGDRDGSEDGADDSSAG